MPPKPSPLRAGISKLDITPREPIWLAGWADRTTPSAGVSQKLWVKVLALQSGGKPVIWLTADLLGYSKSMTQTILRRAQKQFGLARHQIILNATHNHSGPVTGDLLHLYFDLTPDAYAVIARYTTWLLNQMVAAIGQALANLAPVQLHFGQGLAGFGVNRRRARAGGRCLPTIVDQDVPVLTVRSPKGDLRAIMFGYACHTTCANDGTLNGDYAGHAQAQLESKYPGAIAMFTAGCGGDINPLPRWVQGLEQTYGHILATAVDLVVQHPMTPVTGPLRIAFDEARIPFDKLPTANDLRTLQRGTTGIRRREIQAQLDLLKHGDRRPRICPYPIHVWQFASGLKLIALCSEPVAEYAHRFKNTYGWEDLWVCGYNDEFISYIPTLRVWRKGGYEGTTGMMECNQPGPFASCVEEVIAEKVDELWQLTSANPRPTPRPSKHL